jgi:hypothetical protein
VSTGSLIRLVIDRPWVGAAFGGIVAVFCVIFGWRCHADLQAFSAAPAPLEMSRLLADVPDPGRHVELRGATLACDRAHEYAENGYVPLEGGPAGQVVIAAFDRGSKATACSGALTRPLVGVLERMHPRLHRHLIEDGMGGLEQVPRPPVLELCTYCGPDNSRLGVWLCVVMFFGCLLLYPLARVAKRRQDADMYG